jgi:hypothetical protein
MIKKMWFRKLCFGSQALTNSEYNMLSDEEKEIYIPAIVTDEDPFENVRKVYGKYHKSLSQGTDMPGEQELSKAIKKDMQNFPPVGEAGDKGVG